VDWSEALERIGQDARALLSDEAGEPSVSPSDAADAPVAAPSDPAGQPTASDADLDRRLRDLQSRLEIAEFLDEQQRLENEQLRTELAEAAAALTQEIQRTRERTQQLEAEGILVDQASEALIALGPPAIPGLIQALASQDAHVREWAADVLGAMGATGRPALPDLMEAVTDADASVRAAVRRAIDAIEHAEDP
jgi:HEAT repeat protein